MRDYFHELHGDDPFDDERRVVPDGGSVRAPVTFHLAEKMLRDAPVRKAGANGGAIGGCCNSLGCSPGSS
jgi:hypothetical protein